MTVLLVLPACNGRGDFTGGDPEDLDLGDQYQFATADRETSPDEPPIIQNDSLHVWVRYPGGCTDHDFHLGHATRADTAFVWLRHDARGDECEEDFVERLSFRLPNNVLAREHVRLVDPENDLPLIVGR